MRRCVRRARGNGSLEAFAVANFVAGSISLLSGAISEITLMVSDSL